MKSVSTWLLGGALAASLTWNWRLQERGGAEPSATSAAVCVLETPELPIDAERRAALGQVCSSTCGQADELEREADALQAELLSGLAEPEVDASRTQALVERVAELRRRSLEACVRGILEVRRVLTPGEVRTLLECCRSGAQEACGR
jgi:uncharacterized membrane protein